MTNFYTEDMVDFGDREIEMLDDIFMAWMNHGLPNSFYESGVKPAFNMASGYVFLVNDDYQVAMLNGDRLELFHTTPYSGLEGFISDLIEENNPSNLHREDLDYIREHASAANIELGTEWLEN